MGKPKSYRVTRGRKTFVVREGTDATGRVRHSDGTSREISRSESFNPENGDEIITPKGGNVWVNPPLFGRFEIEEID